MNKRAFKVGIIMLIFAVAMLFGGALNSAPPSEPVWTQPLPGPACITSVTAEERIDQHLDWTAGTAVVEVLTGKEVADWTEAYNNFFPPTDFKLDKVVALSSYVYGGRYHVVLIRDGCVVGEGPMDVEVFNKFKLGFGRQA